MGPRYALVLQLGSTIPQVQYSYLNDIVLIINGSSYNVDGKDAVAAAAGMVQ